jgi:hypothetical protein
MTGKEGAVTQISQAGRYLVIFVVWAMFMFLSAFTHDYGVVSFLSGLIMVTQWPCVRPMACESVYAQKDTQA